MALSNLQNPWGTAGDPSAQYEALLKELGLREERGDFMMQRPDSPGDEVAYQSIYGDEGLAKLQNELNASRSHAVTINGQRFIRIGDPQSPSAGFGQQFQPQIQQAAQYDPTYGWVIPEDLATQIAQASYTGGGGNLIPGLNDGKMYLDPLAEAAGYRGGLNPGTDITNAPIVAAAAAGGLAAYNALPVMTAATGPAVAETTAGAGLGEEVGANAYFAGAGGQAGLTPAAAAPAALTPGTPEWDMAQGYNPPAGLPDTPIPGAPGSDTLAKVGATAGTGTALSRIMDGKSTTADWVNVLENAGVTGLGMYSANQQANTLADLAEKSRADLAPFLGRANEWLTNPSAYTEGPGQAAMKGTLAGLSPTFGNPIGSGAALQFATDAGLRDWRDAVTGMANLGLSGEDTRARLGIGAAGAQADMWSNLGGGVSELVNPRRSLADLLREYRSAGLV